MKKHHPKARKPCHQIVLLLTIIFGNLATQTLSFPLFRARSSRLNSNPIYSQIEGSGDIAVQEAVELGRSELSKYFNFPLDDWQLQTGGEILMGHNVIVCAPTGSGKTVCGEMALHAAFDRDLDGIYTTPLKALSNQKYAELRQRFGASNVGLSTGDVSINRHEARLTVMTTEVYRNIAWRSSGAPGQDGQVSNNSNDLRKNAVVVLDEFHYMGIPGRGGVWEECIITSPQHTQIVGLSATLPNAIQLADWMEGVTGRKTILIEAPGSRPVPLKYLFATREGLYPLFRNPDAGPGSPLGLLGFRGDGTPVGESKKKETPPKKEFEDEYSDLEEKLPRGLRVNPALQALAQRRMQRVNRMLERQREKQNRVLDDFDDWDLYGGRKGRGGRSYNSKRMSNREERREKERMLKREMRKAVPSLPVLLARLKEKDLLPAIFFIFSRAGCDQAADTIRTSFKGVYSRDPTVEIDFDDDASQPRRNGKKKGKTPKQKSEGTFEDGNGRTFRMSSDNISDDTFISLMEEKQASDDDFSFVEDSPLAPENWNFYSIAGLLDSKEVRIVAGRVGQFNEENPEIAFTDEVIEQFLFGVGSHHAGMLPAHKAFVESLFRANLMKAVFATETLAAGINMPARTTVVCALAKRDGSGSMSLLETSNTLQMAGRAGRRGMDTSGTCVIVATPFESHDVAAQILTNPIKPITSQFRPSYSLAVNLIARGQGKLDVAKQLVKKSFAMWEKQQLEKRITSASEEEGVGDVLRAVSEERFLSTLIEVMGNQVNRRSAKYDVAFVKYLVDMLKDREMLKQSSKDFEGAALSLELEETTLSCLELELKDAASLDLAQEDKDILKLENDDRTFLIEQVEEQKGRVEKAEKRIRKHAFTAIARIANELMDEDSADIQVLRTAFQTLDSSGRNEPTKLEAEEIVSFAKSSVQIKRKLRKLAKTNPNVDTESLLLEAEKVATEMKDGTWDDMLAINKVLLAFGCLKVEGDVKEDEIFDDMEAQTFEVTPAGSDVGMLSFENALWGFVAMGGTWDVMGASSKYDELQAAMKSFDEDMDFYDDTDETADEASNAKDMPKPQIEAQDLVNHLLTLSPAEMAGYVSCLVAGDSSRSSLSSMDVFRRLVPRQQRAIQVLLDSTDRLLDVQRQYSVDAKSCNCQFDVAHCEVVTAWADGCTWSEALEMSGAAPGDLTRIIGRAMDAVRQFGSLKFNPVRKGDTSTGETVVDPFSRGIHPELRRLCREAAKAMNRYPVKDPLPFEADEEDIFDDDEDKDDDDDDDDKSEEEEEEEDKDGAIDKIGEIKETSQDIDNESSI